MTEPLTHIFVGYDDRGHEAYLMAKHSLEKHATIPIKVHKLHHKELRKEGLFTRGAHINGKTGQYTDDIDGRPFSTQFSFTRFLIAELWRRLPTAEKTDYVMFCDNDFLFTTDIGEMFSEIDSLRRENRGEAPVYCVKHDYNPENEIKLDGCAQSQYNMKLWAAMFVLDMGHPDNMGLTPALVNSAVGRSLMGFCWLDDVSKIAGLEEKWQFIPGHSEKNTEDVATLHWTEGGPYFAWYRDECGYSDLWFTYYEDYVMDKLSKGTKGLEEMVDG